MFEVFSRIKQKHEVKFFCGYYSPIGYAAEKNLAIDGAITRVDENRSHIPGYGPLFLSSVIEAMRRIARFKPDVVVVNNGYEYVNLLIRNYKGTVIPYVGGTDWYKSLPVLDNQVLWKLPYFNQLVSVAASSPIVVKRYRQLENIIRLRKLALRRCALSICVSRYVQQFLNGIDSKIMTKVVYPGVDHDVFKPTFEDKGYLATVTRIHPNKNAMLAVKSVEGTKHKLRIYANMERGFKSYDKYHQQLLSEKGENVYVFLDPKEETMISALQDCSLFLSPARNEGVPLVILEAMACGKFVIGHNTGAQPEFLKGCGTTCGENPYEWRQHINRLMNDRSERIALGKRAHTASMRYSWDKTAREIQDTFEENS